MNRRTFLAAAPTAAISLASLKAPLLVPVDWLKDAATYDEFGWRTCDFCYEDFATDIGNKVPIRQFYEATDDSGLCVCEHCVGEFLTEV